MPTSKEKAKLLYDGHCRFCTKSVELLRRLDWRHCLDYVDIRDPEGLSDLPMEVAPERLLEEMHLIPPSGKGLYHGFGALRWLAWRLPLLWPLAPMLYVPGVPQLGQKLYLWIARNRFRIVPCHGGVCTVPARQPVQQDKPEQGE